MSKVYLVYRTCCTSFDGYAYHTVERVLDCWDRMDQAKVSMDTHVSQMIREIKSEIDDPDELPAAEYHDDGSVEVDCEYCCSSSWNDGTYTYRIGEMELNAYNFEDED